MKARIVPRPPREEHHAYRRTLRGDTLEWDTLKQWWELLAAGQTARLAEEMRQQLDCDEDWFP